MKKRLKNKPDSPTESASTTVPQVQQEDESHPTMVNREMNKPFALVIAIPNDAEMSAVFSPYFPWIVIMIRYTRSLSTRSLT